MKHVYIHCPFLAEADYRLVLERLCSDAVRNITVYTRFPADITGKHIEAWVEVQRAFGTERRILFRNIAVFEQSPRFTKSLCRALRKNGFSVELQVTKAQAPSLVGVVRQLGKAGIVHKLCVDESEDQVQAYRLFSSHGLSISFTHPQYTEQTPAQFDEWLYDPFAKAVNTYGDILHMLLMQTHSPNCRHASCFGNTFFVDKQLQVYLCPHHPDARTKLGSLREAENMKALMNSDTVAALLLPTVQKRQRCEAGCASFVHCQGGCPLQAEEDADCVHYCATVERIRRRLSEVYRDGTLRQINPFVRNAILSALAFGTAFFD